MKDFASWFDPQEYSDFLAESSILFEVNIPLQKQRFENRKKLFQFRASKVRQEGILKMELARDEAKAKAKGIQMGMGESFQQRMFDNFMEKMFEERTPLKSEKRKMRPEVDPADRERDRKRESRKQDKMQGLGNVLIVRHRGIKRVEIIEKQDFDPRNHELIKGKTKNADKGRVTLQDLQNYSQRSDFRNTKTSIKILGKIQKETESQQQAQSEGGEGEATGSNEPVQQAPPPPPRPRAPTDGKEITDESSTYADWDYQIGQLAALMPEILNTLSGKEMSGDAQQAVSDSRTLGESLNRFIIGFQEGFPNSNQYEYELLNKPLPTGKFWSKKVTEKAGAVASFVARGNKTEIGFNVKIGKQIRLCNKGESGIVFESVLNKLKPEQFGDFTPMYKDLVNELRKNLNTRTSYLPISNTGEKTLLSDVMLNKLKGEEAESKKKQIVDRFRDLIENYINQNDVIKLGYIAECLTGNIKFDGGLGSAQMLLTTNKDGTDTKVINMNYEYFQNIAKGKESRINIKFVQGKIAKNSPLEMILQSAGQINEGAQDALSILDNLEEASDPRKLMKLFGLDIMDAVFSTPLNLADYYFEDSDSTNTIIFNPGSSKEEIVSIPVKTNYTPDGKEQNYIERGADELLESYLLTNDCLVEWVKSGKIDLIDAHLLIEQEFNVLSEDRDYRAEYDNYHSKPEQRANRSKRVLARRKLEKQGRVHKGDGKDVDHKNGNPQDNSDDNLRVISKSKNRSMNEEHGAGFEGTSKLLQKYLKNTPYSGNPVPSSDIVDYEEDVYVNGKKRNKKIKG